MNPDFRDMLSALSGEGAEYLLVGAHALAVHGHPRATRDIHIWIGTAGQNPVRVWRALERFGAPLEGLTQDELTRPDLVFQVGVPPHRIDLLTSLDGVEFAAAWTRRTEVELDGLLVPVISRVDLIATKRATGRPQDLADLDALGADDSR